MGNLTFFAQGVRLLIGILLLVALCGGAIFLIWTGLKVLAFRRLQRKGERDEHRRRFDEFGQPRDPRAPGVCDHCGRVFAEVNFRPGNKRICDGCLAADGDAAMNVAPQPTIPNVPKNVVPAARVPSRPKGKHHARRHRSRLPRL